MLKCPECGEQIAEIDVFCAYCGISLSNIQKPEDDLSMSETIVGSSIDFTKDYKPAEPAPAEFDKISGQDEFFKEPTESAEKPLDQTDEKALFSPPPSPFEFASVPAEESLSDLDSSEVADIPIQIIDEKPVGFAQNEKNDSAEPETDLSSAVALEQIEESIPESFESFAETDAKAENIVKTPESDSFMTDIPVPQVIKELEAEQQMNSADEKSPEIFSEPSSEPEFPPIPNVSFDLKPEMSSESTEAVSFSKSDSLELEKAEPENSETSSADVFTVTEPTKTSDETPFSSSLEDIANRQRPAPQSFETPFDFETPQKSESDSLAEQNLRPFSNDFAKADSSSLNLFDDLSDKSSVQDSAVESKNDSAFAEKLSGDFVEPDEVPAFAPVSSDEPLKPLESSLDQENIETLEEPSPIVASTPIPEKIIEERPFTQPNMGQGDTDGRKAAKLKPLDEGTLLNNRYEIVRKIGGGGMGAVYLANDRNLGGITRAVKEMVQSYIELEQQDKAVSDFQREAMILTGLEHPAIPTIFDYFFDDKEGRFYLVMKYISGGDLAGRLRAAPEGRLDEKTVTEWAIQVADVLEYLHKQDPVIVYRDLKPANIMIDGNSGRIMLIDFGIARSINKEEKGVTAVGTMGYAPPELFSGNVEPRSDIYSLGSTMFHLLTGADPQSNPLLIFDFQKNPRPRQINSQLSDQMEQILMRSVEYNAELRFSSAAEMCAALQEHLVNLQAGKVSFGVKAAPSAVGFSEQPVFCGFCGKQIVASDVFCAFCGSQQPIAQQSFHSMPGLAPASVSPTAKLFVLLTNDLDASGFNLEKNENLIGRRDPMSNIFPEVDLSKYDPQTKISRRHARIWRDGNNFMLEDLGSSNGTILHAGSLDSVRLLPRQPRPLSNGDKFKVGDTTLQFTIS